MQEGASIRAGVSIFLETDYQGNLSGVPTRLPPPSEFVTIGTALLVAGALIAPTITLEGGDGNLHNHDHQHVAAARRLSVDFRKQPTIRASSARDAGRNGYPRRR